MGLIGVAEWREKKISAWGAQFWGVKVWKFGKMRGRLSVFWGMG
jgi:hypothetical protein